MEQIIYNFTILMSASAMGQPPVSGQRTVLGTWVSNSGDKPGPAEGHQVLIECCGAVAARG